MAGCEYRVSQNEAGDNFLNNIVSSLGGIVYRRKPRGTIIAGTNSALCQVKLNDSDQPPICELSEMSGRDCPIAQWRRGEVGLDAANTELRQLFGRE